MKRVRCPKCGNYLTFDETRYVEGQTLVFQCTQCNRQFGVRIGTSRLLDKHTPFTDNAPANTDDDSPAEDLGSLIVVENVFHYKQELPLRLGDNVIGRYVQGTNINTPIETVDPSVDTTHCIINVRRDKTGRIIYTLRDAPSNTGTFVQNTILRDNDRLRIEDGTVITIGATTMILRGAGEND